MQLPAHVRQLTPADPLRWLAAGWRDLWRAPAVSLLHGLALVLGAAVILLLGHGHWGLLDGAFSGFALLGPSLATGLYENSRRLGSGQPATLRAALWAWRQAGMRPVVFGLLLGIAGSIWVGLSMLVVTGAPGLPPQAIQGPGGFELFLRYFIVADHGFRFIAWMLAGGMLAAVVFALSAVSVPLMLDRDVGVRRAVLISAAAVGANPLSMLFWAVLIMLLTLLGLASVLGLILVLPWLGHATWHAYLSAVDASALPERRRRID